MTDSNLYPSAEGPFDYRYRYFEESRILELAFRDSSVFVQTGDFCLSFETAAHAMNWLQRHVDTNINHESKSGSAQIDNLAIPELVRIMHELSNRDSKVYTGWFYGSMSPMAYRIITASEIDSQLSGD